MQIDMHYFGTFAMAYAAGFEVKDAHIIATSAQMVDDNSNTGFNLLRPGEAVFGVATAHHPLDAGQRAVELLKSDDSRIIWVPFHFLPGNQGETFEERLICRQDSDVAQKMMDYYSSTAVVDSHKTHALHLMGVAAHAYADTFSHYGFSGIPSRLNHVDMSTVRLDECLSTTLLETIKLKASDFIEMFTGGLADNVGLGHGSVATFPDRPYLKWSYTLPNGKKLVRDNRATFLKGCEQLHFYFTKFCSAYYRNDKQVKVSFEEIRPVVSDILSIAGNCDQRKSGWIDAIQSGKIGLAVEFPVYSATRWIDYLLGCEKLETKPGTVTSDGYNFFAASDYHRNYVLKRLLPEFGLFVA